MDILTARGLAAELGTSTAPIFTAFQNIEELENLVFKKARDLYATYADEAMNSALPFKECEKKYIQFAKDEPELFKLLFMGSCDDTPTHFFPSTYEFCDDVLGILESKPAINKEKAFALYNHLSVYAHGLAVLYAQHNCTFTMEDVDRMLSEVFYALTKE